MKIEQMALFSIESVARRNSSGVFHSITPDMATLCREDFLEAVDRGDRCAISPHHDRADLHGKRYVRVHWRRITCRWCRALGHAYYRHMVRTMQGRQAVAA